MFDNTFYNTFGPTILFVVCVLFAGLITFIFSKKYFYKPLLAIKNKLPDFQFGPFNLLEGLAYLKGERFGRTIFIINQAVARPPLPSKLELQISTHLKNIKILTFDVITAENAKNYNSIPELAEVFSTGSVDVFKIVFNRANVFVDTGSSPQNIELAIRALTRLAFAIENGEIK